MNITPKIFLVASTALYMLPVPLFAMDTVDESRTAGRAAPSAASAAGAISAAGAAGAAAGAGAGAEELRGVGISSVAKLAKSENPSGGDEKKEIAKPKEVLGVAETVSEESGYSDEAKKRIEAKTKIDSAVGLAAKLPSGRTADVEGEIAKAKKALREAEAEPRGISLAFKAEMAAEAAFRLTSQRVHYARYIANDEAEIEKIESEAAKLPPERTADVEGKITKAKEALRAAEVAPGDHRLSQAFRDAKQLAIQAVNIAKATIETEELLRMAEQMVPMVLPVQGEMIKTSIVNVREILKKNQTAASERLCFAFDFHKEAPEAARKAALKAASAVVLTNITNINKETEELIATVEKDPRLPQIFLKGGLAQLSPAQRAAIEQMIGRARETLGKIKAAPEKLDSVKLMHFVFDIMSDLSSIAGGKTKGEARIDEIADRLLPNERLVLEAQIAKAKEALRVAQAAPEDLGLAAIADNEINTIFSAMTAIEPPEAVDANQIGEVDGLIAMIEKALAEVWSHGAMGALGRPSVVHGVRERVAREAESEIMFAKVYLRLAKPKQFLSKPIVEYALEANANAHKAIDMVARAVGSRRGIEVEVLLAKKAIERERAMKAIKALEAIETLVNRGADPENLKSAFTAFLRINQAGLSADEGRGVVLATTPGASAGAAAAAGASASAATTALGASAGAAAAGAGAGSNAGVSTAGAAGVAKDVGSAPGVARDAAPIGASAAAAAGAAAVDPIVPVAVGVAPVPSAVGASAAAAAGAGGNGDVKEAAAETDGDNNAFRVTGSAADKAGDAYDRWSSRRLSNSQSF